MSLHPHVFYLVPDETARIARAAFPKGNPDSLDLPLTPCSASYNKRARY